MMAAASIDTHAPRLEKFPTDIAVELKKFAEKHSFHCAKIRQGKRAKADADKRKADSYITSFKLKCTGVLSEISCQEIEKMVQNAGWYAANNMKGKTRWRLGSRKGYKDDASNDKWEVEEHYHNIVVEKEISEDLANNIRDMGWGAAWFAANSIFGYQKEAELQRANFDEYFDKICGEITVAEILSQRPHTDREHFVPTLGDIEPLKILPLDVAEALKRYAEKAAWHCSKNCLGDRREAHADKIEANNHYEYFKEKCEGLLSDRSCEDIRSMLWNAASYVANKTKSKKCLHFTKQRSQYKADASSDKRGIETKYQHAVKNGEIAETLAAYVREMGLSAAWFAAHTIVGRHDHARLDQAKLDRNFKHISGEISLVAMNFIMDEAQILSQKPKVLSEKVLENNTDVDQALTFSFSVTEGRTHSVSHTIGFTYGINSSFNAGFSGFGEINFKLSFSFSQGHTFAESTSTGTTKSFEFPLSVPAHCTHVAKAMVCEAEMDIPYELVFDFGGARRTVRGQWKGVACTKATYSIKKTKENLLPSAQPAQESNENQCKKENLLPSAQPAQESDENKCTIM